MKVKDNLRELSKQVSLADANVSSLQDLIASYKKTVGILGHTLLGPEDNVPIQKKELEKRISRICDHYSTAFNLAIQLICRNLPTTMYEDEEALTIKVLAAENFEKTRKFKRKIRDEEKEQLEREWNAKRLKDQENEKEKLMKNLKERKEKEKIAKRLKESE